MRAALGAGVLVWVVLFGGVTQAAEGPDCSRPLSLALHEHGLLYRASSNTGIDRDVADELIKRSNCSIQVSLMPRSRIWKMLEAGALDFSLSGISNPERDKFAMFAWYFANKYTLLIRKDARVQQLAEFAQIPKLKLGVIRSFRYSEMMNRFVDTLAATERVIESTSYDALYKNLILNRIQAVIIEPFDYSDLDDYQVRDLVNVIATDDVSIPHGLIMSRKTISSAEAEKWRALLLAMRADGTLQRIFEKYFNREEARAMVNW
ncbi:amino acid ABC transporter substrate-binding protein [Chitinimonas arctica]|uniref:Amino acid ABC transporter substrate-binding protein n=1 Tax=Chitinimonas arctica TaxID=2594795 RepID=A0A516SDF0_9NEIS|nr:transporter substrate-binding domain-containing protein [Chitinimonas arctica]QDQ26160.1 amino acid ABC transporter substrate-binding protein [Chitinimonas arctica]